MFLSLHIICLTMLRIMYKFLYCLFALLTDKNIVFLCPIVTIKCFSFGTIGQLMNETFIVWHNVTHIIINALLMEKENIIMASYLIIIVPNQQMYTQRLYTNINDYCLIYFDSEVPCFLYWSSIIFHIFYSKNKLLKCRRG